jgi:hypothetical protein
MLRFVPGRPVSGVTTQFLHWVLTTLAGHGTKVLLLLWDNASWHVSHQVQQWIKAQSTQPKSQSRGWLSLAGLPPSSEKPVAQQHRTQVGSWQAQCG